MLIARSLQHRGKWKCLGYAFSLAVLAGACLLVLHIVRDIEIDRLRAAVAAMPLTKIGLAMCFVATGYVTLTFYDFFSLRMLGHANVPYRIAAMAGFASYSIGHNLGATVFTAGVMRWRMYAPWGLSLLDIAKMAFLTGLTFWLGNTVVLACSMVFRADAVSAVDQLPHAVNQALGSAALAGVAAYLVWVWPAERSLGRGKWSIPLPNATLGLVQIGIGVLDLSAGGLALYVLLPATLSIDFNSVLVIYVTAALLGFLSHAAGSLGVFEAAILVALPRFAREDLLASLLVFRVIYFILPMLVAVTLLSTLRVFRCPDH